MGLSIGMSSSSYDKCSCDRDRAIYKIVEKPVFVPTPAKLPNPDPKNYRIVRSRSFGKASGKAIKGNDFISGRFILIEINYPDCTNFEGNKILVYEDVTLSRLLKQGSIDPHFTNNKKFAAPIARFIPTPRGWDMGVKFCILLGQLC